MLWKYGDSATRSRAKLLTWMPGVSPEMMPRKKPKKMEMRRRVRESSCMAWACTQLHYKKDAFL